VLITEKKISQRFEKKNLEVYKPHINNGYKNVPNLHKHTHFESRGINNSFLLDFDMKQYY
jgi:hypothetical protein